MNDSPAGQMPHRKGIDRLAQAPQKVPSDALLGEAKELLIVHNGREYRLRMTQNGKLILTA